MTYQIYNTSYNSTSKGAFQITKELFEVLHETFIQCINIYTWSHAETNASEKLNCYTSISEITDYNCWIVLLSRTLFMLSLKLSLW